MSPPFNPTLRPALARALLRKEWAESRPAALAGAAIFLGLPVLWTAIYAGVDVRHEVFPGFATTLLVLGGWLYAAVVGAQIVCRDFGRREGEFLLARPVSPTHVLNAKIVIGLSVVLGIVLVVVGWDALVCGCTRSSDSVDHLWRIWLAAAATCVLAFWTAFAAAAITRQTLSSVMLAGLLLVLLVTVPLMMSWPMRIAEEFDVQRRSLWVLAGLAALVAVALACWVTTTLACRSTRGLRLGTKSVAWITGLTLVGVGTLAMTEVGANVPLSATVWETTFDPKSDYWLARAIGKQRIATVSGSGAFALYDITTKGKVVRRPHVSKLPGMVTESIGQFCPRAIFDERDELYILASFNPRWDNETKTVTTASRRPELWPVHWPDGVVGTPVELPLPATIPDERPTWVGVFDAAVSGTRLYVLSHVSFEDPNEHPFRSVLSVYELGSQGEVALVRTVDIGHTRDYSVGLFGARFLRDVNDRVYAPALTGPWPVDSGAPGECPFGFHEPDSAWGEFRQQWPPALGIIDCGVLAVSSRAGLHIWETARSAPGATPTWPARSILVGEVTASPWARLFRSNHTTLVPGAHGCMWEVHDASAICYDVSDPHRPRKFAHATAPRILDAVSGPEYLLLDHGDGFSLVRHPR